MAYSTFTGPLRIGVGDNAGTVLATRTLALAVTATANTDFTMTVPKGKIVTLLVLTGTAFGAATDAQISIGSTAAGSADYVALQTIKAAAKVSLTFTAALLAMPTLSEGATLYVRIVQTGAASATGAATLIVEYLPVVA